MAAKPDGVGSEEVYQFRLTKFGAIKLHNFLFLIALTSSMSLQQKKPLATAAVAPSLLTQVGMAGTAAVLTVSAIHPIVSRNYCSVFPLCAVFVVYITYHYQFIHYHSGRRQGKIA